MTTKKNITTKTTSRSADSPEIIWGDSWTYMRTVVDTLHEPFLILDKDLRVLAANECFYKLFEVTARATERKLLYNLGNKEWNIPDLKKLLEIILPKDTFFKGFEVARDFAGVGHKVMLLNAREIHLSHKQKKIEPARIILLAMHDLTELTAIAHSISSEHSTHKKELAALNHIVSNLKLTIIEMNRIIKNLSGFG